MTAPIDIDCPRCKVTAGRWCENRETYMIGMVTGEQVTVLDYHHAERVDAAMRRNDEVGRARLERLSDRMLSGHRVADELAGLRTENAGLRRDLTRALLRWKSRAEELNDPHDLASIEEIRKRWAP